MRPQGKREEEKEKEGKEKEKERRGKKEKRGGGGATSQNAETGGGWLQKGRGWERKKAGETLGFQVRWAWAGFGLLPRNSQNFYFSGKNNLAN